LKSLCYIAFALLLSWTHCAQGQQQDFVGVTGISVSKQLNRSWDVTVGTQASFNQNLNELWFAFSDVSLGYSINRNWSTEFHVRQIGFRNLENTYEHRQLFYHTLQWSKGFGKWSFGARNRLQQLVYGEHFNDAYRGPVWYNRNHFSVRYRINYYWAINATADIMVPLNHVRRSGIDQFRCSAGLSYTYSERLRFAGYYQLQQQLQRSGGNNAYFVVGLLTSIKIP
jgi:hypothetical protein